MPFMHRPFSAILVQFLLQQPQNTFINPEKVAPEVGIASPSSRNLITS